MGPNSPRIGVIITTKNEENNIDNCLKSIFEQTWQNIELIVVDNFSTDDTHVICVENNVTVIQKGPERSAQRNEGVRVCSDCDFVMYVDADMLLTPTLIEDAVGFMAPEDAALYIHERVLCSGFFGKVRDYERSFYSGTVIDAARFIRRQSFIDIGGFDENLIAGPEDWDLDKRLRSVGNVRLLDLAGNNDATDVEPQFNLLLRSIEPKYAREEPGFTGIYHNESELHLKQYVSKKRYYAGSMNPYIEKWGREDSDVQKQLGFAYRFFGVFFEQGKWRKVLKRPHLFIAVITLRALVGVQFLAETKLSKKARA